MKIAACMTIIVGILLTVAMLFTSDWARPPVETAQIGYRGLGMEQVADPRAAPDLFPTVTVPDIQPPAERTARRASQAYQNVRVLGDLTVNEFDRVMAAITSWVSPEQGCTYCHDGNNLAADKPYTKIVARRMIEMTRHINAQWKDHVGGTGVSCFSCHRGKPVPENISFVDPGPKQSTGLAGNRAGQNTPSSTVGMTALPYDPLTSFLTKDEGIRVASTTALPTGNRQSIQQTEKTYGLMMHLSEALGVNCTHCHNTRSFFAWDDSTPQRQTAYHGITMVRDLNTKFLDPLKDSYPLKMLGAMGDAPKANCATCHQGAPKPLTGANMYKDYPELSGK